MNRKKIGYLIVKIVLILVMVFGMFVSSGIALLGSGIMNLILTILSFDELFVESPFNQTSLMNIKANLTPLIQGSMVMFLVGILLTIICGLLICWIVIVDLDEKIMVEITKSRENDER